MEFFYNVIVLNLVPFALLICIVTFVHEWGHFIVARYFGVRVEVFSIGFGKKIFQWKWRDTNFCISILPFGGYVKMFGINPNEDVAEHEKKHAFKHKGVWPRIAIVSAGPLINCIFAILLFAFIAFWGEPFPKAVIGDVAKKSHPYKLGFRSGDKIVSVDGQKITHWSGFQDYVKKRS